MNTGFCDNVAGFTGRFERSEQNHSRLSVLTPSYSITCILDLQEMQLLHGSNRNFGDAPKGVTSLTNYPSVKT